MQSKRKHPADPKKEETTLVNPCMQSIMGGACRSWYYHPTSLACVTAWHNPTPRSRQKRKLENQSLLPRSKIFCKILHAVVRCLPRGSLAFPVNPRDLMRKLPSFDAINPTTNALKSNQARTKTDHDHLNLVAAEHLPRPLAHRPCLQPATRPRHPHLQPAARPRHCDDGADLIREPRDDNFVEPRVPASLLGRDDSNKALTCSPLLVLDVATTVPI
jgi:hypothetical protein